jgi:hypothetical protein
MLADWHRLENATQILELLTMLLVSFHRATLRFSGDIKMDGSRLFEMLEQECGLILGNYCQLRHT